MVEEPVGNAYEYWYPKSVILVIMYKSTNDMQILLGKIKFQF